jgi:cysteine-rich repeat protein
MSGRDERGRKQALALSRGDDPHRAVRAGLSLACALALGLLLASAARAATVTIINGDGPGEGFNDPTAAIPVGGNSGTTLGEQRLIAMQFAGDLWGTLVGSDVPITVSVTFDSLGGDQFGAPLGAAGPEEVFRDFPGAPLPATWYSAALTNALLGADENPSLADIGAVFNKDVDGGVLGSIDWYYGLDANPGGDVDFVTTALHEIGHGLGFLSLVDSSGSLFLGFNDVYSTFLEDHSAATLFPAMNNAQRSTALRDDGDLHFVGPNVLAASGPAGGCVDASGHVAMYAPSSYDNGSSTSHWDISCTPSELMEPFDTGANHDVGLAIDLFLDLGWPSNDCGNSLLDAGEGCDDGGVAAGDGCDATCQVEACYTCDLAEPSNCTPDNGAACDDGLACTTDQCSAGSCVGNWSPVACALDPYKAYKAKTARKTTKFPGDEVTLADVLESKVTNVIKPALFADAVDVEGAGVNAPEVALECYKIKDSKNVVQPKFSGASVQVTNAFGVFDLELVKATTLCVPASVDLSAAPGALPPNQADRFKCYKAKPAPGEPKPAFPDRELADLLELKETESRKVKEVCNPVSEDGSTVYVPTDHLVCYQIKDSKTPPQAKFVKQDVFVRSDFGPEKLTAVKSGLLCLPSSLSVN